MEFNIKNVFNSLLSKSKDDELKVTGNVSLNIFKDGVIFDAFEAKNIVVNNGFELICKLLGGANTDSVTNIGFGTSSAPAVPTSSTLTNVFSKTLDGITYPTYNSVQFAFSLGLTENNGVTIEEIGLINSVGSLFSRRLYTIIKDNTVRIEGTWTISIS